MKRNKPETKKQQPGSEKRIVRLSAGAAEKMKQALGRYSAAGVRIVAERKENGPVSFGLDLEESSRPDDLVTEERGIKLFVDQTSVALVRGLEIRYVETERGSGFAFVNPGG